MILFNLLEIKPTSRF